jgi:Predicted kinase related to galactokinase and mevalonate kinase
LRRAVITRRLVGLVDQGRQALLTSLDYLGPLLDEAWQLKREVSQGVTNAEVDAIYECGVASGATGGKLLGAGGSGYLAFYVPNDASSQFTTVFPEQLAFTLSNQGAGIIHES